MKKYLHLDKDFQPFGESLSFQQFTFSGGEPHIKLTEFPSLDDNVVITARANTFDKIGFILLAVDALRRAGVKHIELLLPYFPGARQDRAMVAGEPLTAKVYADIINALQLQKVTILDAHSDVVPALLNNVENVSNKAFVRDALREAKDYLLVSPDGGALKKIYQVAQILGGVEVVECGKKRDVSTGKLSGFRVFADDLEGKTCVVVDDICDGGGTFLGLAEQLKKHNAGKLILVVTHGIFSNGSEALRAHFNEIICTDSFRTITDENIRQIKLTNELLKN